MQDAHAKPWMSQVFVPGLLSVVIPSKDRADLISDAIHSVLGQAYRPVEVVVIDDGSTDATATVVSRLSIDTPAGTSIVYLPQPRSMGPSTARNIGLRACRGEFILHLDSDDMLIPGRLDDALAVLVDCAECDVVISACLIGDESVLRLPPADPCPSPATFALTNVPNGTVIFRRAVIASAGPWRESLRTSEDREFHTRVLFHARRVELRTEPLLQVRNVAENQLSRERGLAVRLRSVLEARTAMVQTVRLHGHGVRDVERVFGARCLQDALAALARGEVELAHEALSAWRNNVGPHPRYRQRLARHALMGLSTFALILPSEARNGLLRAFVNARRLFAKENMT